MLRRVIQALVVFAAGCSVAQASTDNGSSTESTFSAKPYERVNIMIVDRLRILAMMMILSAKFRTRDETCAVISAPALCAQPLPLRVLSSSSRNGSPVFVCSNSSTVAHDAWAQVMFATLTA